MTKKAASYRLSAQALDLLREIAERLGLSQAGVLEMIIRERAEFMRLQDQNRKGGK